MNKGTGPVGQPCPITIVGGGLAGCMMAWALSARGRQVRLFDRGEEVTSSKVAAGIINPVTGPKLTKAWRFEELWPAALRFYESIQQKTGKKNISPDAIDPPAGLGEGNRSVAQAPAVTRIR